MEQSRSQSSNRAQDERRRRDREDRRQREQPATGSERRAELAVERNGGFRDRDAQPLRAPASAAQQRVAQPAGQLAVQQTLARQQQAVRLAGQAATRAAGQQPTQQS
jgi:hypothetical protein